MFSGGIRLDVDYSPALLYQLAKMDGAIVLEPETYRIMWANVQLMPDPTILSMETGTRHRTAERVSKQSKALVIAISQRREVVSLYVEGIKYILEDIPSVLSKANQGLATLEKYRARLDQVSARLTQLEFRAAPSFTTSSPSSSALELVTRMAAEVERWIIELGCRGPPDRDAARRARPRRLRRARGARPRLRGRCLRARARARRPRASPSSAITTSSTSAVSPSTSATTARRTPLTSLSYREASARFRACRGFLVWWPRRSLTGSATSRPSSTPRTQDLAAVDGVGEARATEIREGLRRAEEVDAVDRQS